jgi:hypothetical protein
MTCHIARNFLERTRLWRMGWAALATASVKGLSFAAFAVPVDVEFFETRIRPVLASECYECHGATKQEAGLRLDFASAILTGGDSGPAVIVGDPGQSLLLRSIRHSDPDQRMPKGRKSLPPAVIADFENWILAGAPDPRQTTPTEDQGNSSDWDAVFRMRKQWWSFQPVIDPPVPSAGAAAEFDHPVDRFLAEKLDAAGLVSSPSADRRTLLRRVSFALTGLPPKPEEMLAFINDDSPEAFIRVVDRLLATPEFGERWARHWMDLMRFAETHGSEGDPDIPYAFEYRDYLIRAMNQDVPWNQLIREHIAGDLLPNPRLNHSEAINESAIGPAQFRLLEHGYQPIDTLEEQVKTIDNQIDVISKAFQGLTISCARCHDHKFDPISQRDYYALYGILSSSRPGHVAINIPERLQLHREELTRLKSEIKRELAASWMATVKDLRESLLAAREPGEVRPLQIEGSALRLRIQELERQIGEVIERGRATALAARSDSGQTRSAVAAGPMAVWTFDHDAADAVGELHGELHGGAEVRDGRLILNGEGAFLITPPLAATVVGKTLEAWVSLSNLDQRGGGVMTIESADGHVFDSIVFGERNPGKWMAGSEYGVRFRDVDGPKESAGPAELVHLAIAYRDDGEIAIYRNGVPYGSSYLPQPAQRFSANSARLLIGKRHTGGGNPFFQGEIHEARIYPRMLSPEEISESFRRGADAVSDEEIVAALEGAEREEFDAKMAELELLRHELSQMFPDAPSRLAALERLAYAINATAGSSQEPLAIWHRLRESSVGTITDIASAVPESDEPEGSRIYWKAEEHNDLPWFALGANPPATVPVPGEFVVELEGDKIIRRLLQAGVFSHLLSSKHQGIFTSPKFVIETNSISVLVVGGMGARVRVIPDNYPLGNANIFPQVSLASDRPTWVRLDTAYRKGSTAHLELVTANDSLSRERAAAGADGRSFFGISKVVFHDGPGPTKTEPSPLAALSRNPLPTGADEFANALCDATELGIAAWNQGIMDPEQAALLDSFVRSGLLPTSLSELPKLARSIADYRRLEREIPLPRRVPGLWETTGSDAPLLPRGNHRQPQDLSPRGYISAVSNRDYQTDASGRLELADDLVASDNPLTARVMVNRIWHHLFGRGLVSTVDNFGRLGDPPSHPELLDFLACRFVESDWSAKQFIRYLLATAAWQRASEPSAGAREIDPANLLLSHARVRRLEAEAVRDSLLSVSGRLSAERYGTGANALAEPADQRRRSVYLTIRRNFLSPFLDVFDAPRPFSTLGQRDATNVPGQSLAMLNDPFVIDQADRWAAALLQIEEADADRVVRMFETALGRPPTEVEHDAANSYLTDLSVEHGVENRQAVWRDLAQSIFNLKEFIYLR